MASADHSRPSGERFAPPATLPEEDGDTDTDQDADEHRSFFSKGSSLGVFDTAASISSIGLLSERSDAGSPVAAKRPKPLLPKLQLDIVAAKMAARQASRQQKQKPLVKPLVKPTVPIKGKASYAAAAAPATSGPPPLKERHLVLLDSDRADLQKQMYEAIWGHQAQQAQHLSVMHGIALPDEIDVTGERRPR